MSSPIAPFVPGRFSSTVPFYVEGRLDYPLRLISNVARWLGIAPPARVLDLGCGPGFLAISFAKLGCAVTGLDPNREMLEAAAQLAARERIACEFREGSSYDLSPALGRCKLVTMGRSFHWMDRPATLVALDGMIEADGAIALFNDRHLRCRENRWVDALEEIRQAFDGREEFSQLQKAGDVERHEIVLLASPFSRLESMGITERRSLSLEGAITRALSFSGSSPQRLGERRPAFEAALREALTPYAEGGRLSEVVEFVALIAKRADL
jgi:SAM-dependent methyltransferase